jgi:hypothetical protein
MRQCLAYYPYFGIACPDFDGERTLADRVVKDGRGEVDGDAGSQV